MGNHRRQWIHKTVVALIVLGIIYFLAQQLFYNWEQVQDFEFSFSLPALVLSILLLGANLPLLSVLWNRMLRAAEPTTRLSFAQACQTYVVSEFGRYIPGKVWTVLGKVYLGAQANISKKALLSVSVLDAGLALLSTLMIGLVVLSLAAAQLDQRLVALSLALIVFGLLAVHPRVFYPVLNVGLKKIGRTPIAAEQYLSYGLIVRLLLGYGAVSLLRSLAFAWFTIALVGPVSMLCWFLLIGGYAFAVGIGVVAVVAPSGLGIREGVLGVILAVCFPAGVGLALSFLARIWATLVEVLVLISVLIARRITQRIT